MSLSPANIVCLAVVVEILSLIQFLLETIDIQLSSRFASPGFSISFLSPGNSVRIAPHPHLLPPFLRVMRCAVCFTKPVCLLSYMLSRAKQTATNSVIVLSNGNALPSIPFCFLVQTPFCHWFCPALTIPSVS